MKKSIFYYLFAVICSVSLFTSCSDDDEDTTWKEIPEITNDNVTLKFNDKDVPGATAAFEVLNAESGKLTLNNAVYGYDKVEVAVTMSKKDDTSYNYTGTASLQAPSRANLLPPAPLTVKVSGVVSTNGKLSVDVETSGWASVSGVYKNDSLSITMDGKAHSHDSQYAVTLIAGENGSKAILHFKKIINVALDVEASVTLENGKISGTVTPLTEYNIAISGTVANGKLDLNLTSSGVGTIAKSYSAGSNTINFNGSKLTSGSVSVKALSATEGEVSFSGILSGDRSATIKKAVLSKEDGKEVYNISGEEKTENYTISIKGTINEAKVLTAEIKYEVVNAIVGKWNLQKQQVNNAPMASTIFNFATNKGSITFPKDIVDMIPDNMKPIFPETMVDAQFQATIQGLLGSYAVYLQSVEFTKEGKMIATYVDMPTDTNGDGKIDAADGYNPTPQTFDMLKYYVKDGQLYLTVSLEDLMGMIPQQSNRAWDPGTILTEGIPFNTQIAGNTLSLTLATDVTLGTVTFANMMLPFIGMMMPNLAEQLEPIQALLGVVVEGMFPDVKQLEVGLVFEK